MQITNVNIMSKVNCIINARHYCRRIQYRYCITLRVNVPLFISFKVYNLEMWKLGNRGFGGGR